MKIFSINLKEIDSTQELSRYIITKKNYANLYDLIVIKSKKQFEGKGQNGNKWSSEIGGLYLTISMKSTEEKIKEIQSLSTKTAELISRLLRENYKIQTRIKFPNDVYALTNNGYKKISGILIETIPLNNIRWVLIGIGINFYNSIPPELKNKATSLFEITNKKHNITIFAKKLIKGILELKV